MSAELTIEQAREDAQAWSEWRRWADRRKTANDYDAEYEGDWDPHDEDRVEALESWVRNETRGIVDANRQTSRLLSLFGWGYHAGRGKPSYDDALALLRAAWPDDAETMIPVVTEPDHETYPHEITRGGITWGVERPISDDEVVAAFIFEGKITPTIWVDQAFPARYDLLTASAIGIDGGPVEVRARHWNTPTLLLIGVARFDGEVPEVVDEDEP